MGNVIDIKSWLGVAERRSISPESAEIITSSRKPVISAIVEATKQADSRDYPQPNLVPAPAIQAAPFETDIASRHSDQISDLSVERALRAVEMAHLGNGGQREAA